MGGYSEEERMPDLDYYRKPKYPIWIETLKVFLMFAPGVMILLYAGYDLAEGTYRYTPFALGFLLMPIFATIIRRSVRNLLFFLIPHILFGVYVYFLSPHIVMTAIGFLYVIILTVYGLVRQMSRQGEREMTMLVIFAAVFIMLVVYGMAIYRGHGEYEMMLLGQGLSFVVLFLFYQHRISLLTTLGAIDKDSNFSTKHVIGFNTRVYFIYISMAVALFIGLYIAGFGDLLRIFGRWLLLMIRKIVRALVKVDPTPETIEKEAQEAQQIQQDIGMVIGQGIETAMIWIILQKILEVVTTIGLIALAIYLIYRFIRRFMSSYQYVGSGYEETRVNLNRTVRDKVREGRLSIFDRSPENLIRREYWKKVRPEIDKTVLRSDTPEQAGDKLASVQPIVQDYDRVRYGKKK
jgi:hypothetical protein